MNPKTPTDALRALPELPEADNARVGRAYLRWYGAARGYKNVIADVAHAAIMHDAALQAANPVEAQQNAYLRAVDEGRITACIGTAEPTDDYETAQRKLGELIDWHIRIATDPAVNGGFKLVPIEAQQSGKAVAWRPMDTAPRDGTMVRLLVDFTEHATEDSPDPAPTIGANNFDNDGENRWQFAGWCWTHDHFTEGKGTPVGWLPMLDAAPHLVEAQQGGEAVTVIDAELYDALNTATSSKENTDAQR